MDDLMMWWSFFSSNFIASIYRKIYVCSTTIKSFLSLNRWIYWVAMAMHMRLIVLALKTATCWRSIEFCRGWQNRQKVPSCWFMECLEHRLIGFWLGPIWHWVRFNFYYPQFGVEMNSQTFTAYVLANDGYDVWMLNCRGSKYSMRHRSIDPSTFQFWQFSFHEIGIFDYPAAIDYMIALTEKPSVYFIGHNQATSAMLALLSTRPDYSAKLLHLHFLAPIAWMDYIHPLSAFNADRQMRSFYMTRTYNFFSIQDLSKIFIKSYCNDGDPSLLPFCMNMWFMLFGRNRNGTEMDPMLIYEIPKYVSPTASTRQWNHYLQIHKSTMFQTYDGEEDSYYEGGPIPYNLDLIRSPVFLYHGAEDLVVSKLVKCGTKKINRTF